MLLFALRESHVKLEKITDRETCLNTRDKMCINLRIWFRILHNIPHIANLAVSLVVISSSSDVLFCLGMF